MPYFIKAQGLSTAYARFALALLRKTPAGVKHDQVQKHAADRLKNAVRPAVDAWQKQIFERLLQGLPFDPKAVEDPQKILARFEQETRTFAAKIKRSAKNSDVPAADPGAVQAGLESPGRPLEGEVQGFMEEQLGRSFANVRVHTDAAAQAAAQALNAQAFTVGDDVVFGAGQYAPETVTGKRLLAHELVHVMQQEGGGAATRDADRAVPDFTFEAVQLSESTGEENDTGALSSGAAPNHTGTGRRADRSSGFRKDRSTGRRSRGRINIRNTC
ncbi:MAG: DUF4157 domain-containing protein [Anaerolineales bacterium]|nr:DUF4157 domain-containing protein [Anaerolineales bacterium]